MDIKLFSRINSRSMKGIFFMDFHETKFDSNIKELFTIDDTKMNKKVNNFQRGRDDGLDRLDLVLMSADHGGTSAEGWRR